MSSLRHHRVLPGEQLIDIARIYYGPKCGKKDALFIWQHNRDIVADPNQVYAGQYLTIPHAPR